MMALVRMANGHYSYGINAKEDYMPALLAMADILIKEFGFKSENRLAVGPDGTYLDLYKDGVQLTAGWDIWSGVFAMAFCDRGDVVIQALPGRYRGAIISDPRARKKAEG